MAGKSIKKRWLVNIIHKKTGQNFKVEVNSNGRNYAWAQAKIKAIEAFKKEYPEKPVSLTEFEANILKKPTGVRQGKRPRKPDRPRAPISRRFSFW
ncbi:hypothetical protein COV49_03770 [Candidatus Falkowbacteria bacterium CG11_big_fil_rev_8_21_14_0_20_39_10]|uniref:Uncharacterized protein n=1 Tax=Candidatus Falkowbacteria bacterium CG11_big_fil_rev_8_21_14_0_20_39_10 TaxID=1974570 RepID=A0A2M6K8C7_9BACT|nr:MAG: hypothetical protein COV49_03770 [Candidatus Falkowbacteria bacterium CG11_big_fil_rev_8_21_14_0_20_39_10]